MAMHKDNFTPKKIKLVASKEKLTSAAGLGTLVEAFDLSPLKEDFKRCLPKRVGNNSKGSYRLGLIQLSSLLYGHDCLDDLIEFKHDPSLEAVLKGETVLPKTMGNFLRDFSDENIKDLESFLSFQSHTYTKFLKEIHPIHFKAPECFDIDSTPHEQRGKKIEGTDFNYKKLWCLDSQVVFNQWGLCSSFKLRPGNTKSGVNAPEQIQTALKPLGFKDQKYVRGDSAYCNQFVIKTCLSEGAKFTFTANDATTSWEDQISFISNWTDWEYTPEEKTRAKEKEKELPKVQVGSFLWTPSWNESLRFPVVVKRTPKEQADLFSDGYDYYGVVTNFSLFSTTAQEVFLHHQKRGNAENFIREEKYGYDLKHFPCLKLNANRAYGLLAMIAHNLLRFAALTENPKKTKFAKKFRRSFISIPGKLVEHARSLVLKVPVYFLEEVNRLREGLQLNPETVTAVPLVCSSG